MKWISVENGRRVKGKARESRRRGTMKTWIKTEERLGRRGKKRWRDRKIRGK